MKRWLFVLFVILNYVSYSQIVNVGKGSYSMDPPKFVNGIRDVNDPKGCRPMNIYFPCISQSNLAKKWTPVYPAVTEDFRKSGKKPTTNQFWSSVIFKFNGGTYSSKMHPGPLAVECAADGLKLSTQRYISVNNNVPSGANTTASINALDWGNDILAIGVENMNADSVLLDDYGDWHARVAWKKSDSISMKATFARGIPYVFFEAIKGKVKLFSYNTGGGNRFSTWYRKKNILGIKNEASKELWIICLPDSATYRFQDSTPPDSKGNFMFRSCLIDLKGKDYLSACFVFDTDTTETNINLISQYAFSFIRDTKASWNYDESTAIVKTDFNYTTEAKQGIETKTIIGLLPHHYNNLDKAYTFSSFKYPQSKGWVKTIEGNTFSTKLKVPGFLYHFPDILDTASKKFKKDTLIKYLSELNKLDLLQLVPDFNTTYGHGKSMTRLMSAVQAASAFKDTNHVKLWENRVKTVFENWMTSTRKEIDSSAPSGLIKMKKPDGGDTLVPDTASIGNYLLFYYNKNWCSLYGLPAGFNTETEFNDHHFTWGYFIRTAIELMGNEGRAYGADSSWGGMVKLLIRDIVGDYRKVSEGGMSDKGDSLFPRFRNWDPYIGFGLASGHADFNDGNNQESSSEAMDFNASVALFGAMNGDKYYRDLGLYLYATTLSAIENYWFDVKKQNLWHTSRDWQKVGGNYVRESDSAAYKWSLITLCWDSKSELTNFFKPAIEYLLGIQFLPFSPTSLYLARYPAWYTDVYNNTYKKLVKKVNGKPDGWQNIWWSFLAMYQPSFALSEFNNFRNFTSDSISNQEDLDKEQYGENGNSRSYTYYWIWMFNELGALDTTAVTSSTPFYAVFHNQTTNKNTYIAYNPTDSLITVQFTKPERISFNVPAFSTMYNSLTPTVVSRSKEKDIINGIGTGILNFDTISIGDDSKLMYQYINDTDELQVIDDLEIPDTTDKGFYIVHLDEEKFVLPGHSYIGVAGFNPEVGGLAEDSIEIVIDSVKGTTIPFIINLIGFARGPVAVENNSEKEVFSVKVYPNPASACVTLSFYDKLSSNDIELLLVDILGNIIIQSTIPTGTQNYELNLKTINTGTYFIKLVNGNRMYSKKVLIVK